MQKFFFYRWRYWVFTKYIFLKFVFPVHTGKKKKKNLNSEFKFHYKFHCCSIFYIFLLYLYLLWHPTTQLWLNSDLNSCNDLLSSLFFIMLWLMKILLLPLFSLPASISFLLFRCELSFQEQELFVNFCFM